MTVKDLKNRLIEGDITSYAWLLTERMWADILTKEKGLPSDLEDVLTDNIMDIAEDTNVNEVKAVGDAVRMENIRNRNITKIEDGEELISTELW